MDYIQVFIGMIVYTWLLLSMFTSTYYYTYTSESIPNNIHYLLYVEAVALLQNTSWCSIACNVCTISSSELST